MDYAKPRDETDPNASYHDPDASRDGSIVPAAAIEPPMRELVHLIKQSGLSPNKNDLTQVFQAVKKLIDAVDLSGYVQSNRKISTSAPLTGGGDLSQDRALGIQDATTAQKGAVQLNNTVTSTSTTLAGTANAVKTAYDRGSLGVTNAAAAQTTANAAAPATRNLSTTAPLTGGGSLAADRTLGIQDASTTQKGAVQLSDSVSSTSTTLAATANAVKKAYDLAYLNAPKPQTASGLGQFYKLNGNTLPAGGTWAYLALSTTPNGQIDVSLNDYMLAGVAAGGTVLSAIYNSTSRAALLVWRIA